MSKFGQFSRTFCRPFDHYLLTLILHKRKDFPTQKQKNNSQNVIAPLFCLFLNNKITLYCFFVVVAIFYVCAYICAWHLCLNAVQNAHKKRKWTHTPICSSKQGPVNQAVRSATLLLEVRFSPDRPLVGM